jgi:hypothetical protein
MRRRPLKSDARRTDRGPMAVFGVDVEEDLRLLDAKLKQLRLDYEQYFLGSRPREPQLLRGEVQKMVAYYANVGIKNTGHRFRFNTLQARLFSMRRQWDTVLRKIEDGTYERHLFKADLHQRERRAAATSPASAARAEPDLFEQFLEARRSCGQDAHGIDRPTLDALVEKQRQAVRERYGCKDVRFRVVVEEGRVKVKATPVA